MNFTNITTQDCIEMIQAEQDRLRENPQDLISNEIVAMRLGMMIANINDAELRAKDFEILNLSTQIKALEE